MQQKTMASVVVIREDGEKRLRDAVALGLVPENIKEDVEKILLDIDTERANCSQLRFENRRLNEELKKYKGIYYRAVKDSQQMKMRYIQKTNIISTAIFSAVAAGVLGVVIVVGFALVRALIR